MKRSWPHYLVLAFFWLCLSVTTVTAQIPAPAAALSAAVSDKSSLDYSIYTPDNAHLPAEMLDLMRASRVKYIEGSSLIRTGDSEKARESFDQSVDLILRSRWDLPSTPSLNAFFQDLIKRIQEDESRYLLAQYNNEAESAFMDNLDNVDLTFLIEDPSLREAIAADLANNKYDIPITINEPVVKSLDYWLNRGRQYFINGLQRSGQYRPIIEKVFKEESIPLDLMYLAQVESLFRTDAVSKAKAKGIWQFEKATAIRYGLKVTRDVDERSDPEKSTRAAARYLSDLYAMFKDWNLVLAAYNWGEGNVQRLINSTGLNDFWQFIDLKKKLPEETKKHVPMIQASVILAKNPENYGLSPKLDPPLEYTKVSVSKPIDLRAAAKILSMPINELQKLNPALRGLTTPANYPNFQLKVPADSDPNTHQQLDALPVAKIKPPPEYSSRHKVRAGETIAGIAARYHISAAELEKANKLSPKKKLIAGTWLQVPASGGAAKTPAVRTPAVRTPAVRTPAVRTPAVRTPALKTAALKTAALKTAAAKLPTTKTSAVKTPAVKTPAAKTPAAKTPAAKTPTAKTTAVRTLAAKTPAAKLSAAKKSTTQVQSAKSHSTTISSGKKPDPKTAAKQTASR